MTLANRDALLAVLSRALPATGTVLELGSGTGEHAVYFAARLPGVAWQPSDPDAAARESIAAWTAEASLANVLPPLDLDVLAPAWRLRRADAVVCVNVLHVAPEGAREALVGGAATVLPRGGPLVISGPFTAGDVDALVAAAARELVHEETAKVPPGCACVVLRRR
jgi:SAM-dependent methyltransferase